MPHYPHILFDLDGTLADSESGVVRSLIYAFQKIGCPPPPARVLGERMGASLRDMVSDFLPAPTLFETFREHYLACYRDNGVFLSDNRPFPGVVEMVEHLAGLGHHLYLATMKREDLAQQVIENFGLTPHFTGVYGTLPNTERNDKAAVIAHILTTHTIAPDQAIMVGDRRYDIEGAAQNGMLAIGVLWGAGTTQEFQACHAAHTAETPEDVLRIVAG